MPQGRISMNFSLKVKDVSKIKDEYFGSFKNKFKSIIISEKNSYTHNEAIKNDFRVDLRYIIDMQTDFVIVTPIRKRKSVTK